MRYLTKEQGFHFYSSKIDYGVDGFNVEIVFRGKKGKTTVKNIFPSEEMAKEFIGRAKTGDLTPADWHIPVSNSRLAFG